MASGTEAWCMTKDKWCTAKAKKTKPRNHLVR
jgi:hypothetical protein